MSNRPIKVLFDAGPLANGQKSGVGYYTYQLVEALAKNFPDELELVGHYFNFLGRKSPDLPKANNIRYKSSKLLPGKIQSILRRVGLQLPFDFLVKTRGDIALFTNFVSVPTLQKIKKVVVIHDLCYLDFPEYLQPANRAFLQRFVPSSLKEADLVMAVSHSTKKAIIAHYHTIASKIAVTPITPPAPTRSKVKKPSEFVLPKNFILFMGTLEPRKNYITLVRAYAMLPVELKKLYGLVLAGGYGWQMDKYMDEINMLRSGGENIILTNYISGGERTFLYQNATALVLPSHYEGFGMPILEAMSYGLPVLASDIPVFHEVAGDAALYFDKDNPEALAKVLEKILTNKALRQELIRKADDQLEEYGWDKVADDVMSRFKDLIGKGDSR